MSVAPSSVQDPHLLVVDDDERLRALLQRYLATNGYRVTAAPNAQDARALMKSMAFDLLILDVMMPGESGFDLTKSVRQSSQVPILILTAKGDAGDRIAGLEHGADDYLPKPFEPRELLLRVTALLRRAAPPALVAHSEVKMGEATYDAERGQLRRKGKPVHLTSSEAALLKLFAANAGRSFSRSDLCTRLGVTLERSIDVQVTRLRRKIEEDPKLPLYLQTVRGVGYVLVPDRVS
ncbi:MAG: response regulator [Alphaproteobacteria bacterium]|nr:response regulator [Alphaproteobacteria bacterium]MBL6938645.1 response regulator [Alphaproteobacteria bacterium]MBL7097998.1 response regulator [Alphaproteobacteria bacterium]